MSEQGPQKRPATGGSPAWMTTFADLMSLLMCFFVLLLSFSEMDVQKYKQVAGSMAMAFGVQRDILAESAPMGTSFVAREYKPGRPELTSLQVMQQQSNVIKPDLDLGQRAERSLRAIVERLRAGLADEIRQGAVSIETEGNKAIIRIQEKSSFPSGSAELMGVFRPTIAKIAQALVDIRGRIVVAGHTDDVPIASARFRSNWELSASRAVTVLHALLSAASIPAERLRVEGYGDVQPLAPNDSPENRALNRRVEISVIREPELDPRTPGTSPVPLSQAPPP